MKLCECGCGELAPTVKKTGKGFIKGQQRRFVLGHHVRLFTKEQFAKSTSHREKLSKASSKHYENPGARVLTSKTTKAAMQRPDVREKFIKGMDNRIPHQEMEFGLNICELCGEKFEKKSGSHAFCVPCRPLARRYNGLAVKHGVTVAFLHELHESQQGKCAICERMKTDTGRNLSLDHCHLTMKVRGFLCNNCNAGLGYFRDRSELLQKAVLYLKEEERDPCGSLS